jgi:cytochrome c-type biogenesis protein CcmH/NrfG
VLAALAQERPDLALAYYELGLVLAASGESAAAEAAFQDASRLNPLLAAAIALNEAKLSDAERLLSAHLTRQPADVAALRMLADTAGRLGQYDQAEALLAHCVALAPGFIAARYDYALVLHRQGKSQPALLEVERLIATDPHSPTYRDLKASALMRLGDIDAAIQIYHGLVSDLPTEVQVWLSYGHALKAGGRTADGVEAYRQAIRLDPRSGEAYWSLANLKTVRFRPDERAAMDRLYRSGDLDLRAQAYIGFALGKAFEDEGRFSDSFACYAEGNRLRRSQVAYQAAETRAYGARCKDLFTADFFAARAGWGLEAADPIFIVGLPRSGSTLLEQILASHSQVEGTQELPDIGLIVRDVGGLIAGAGPRLYPQGLARLTRDQCRELGQNYIDRTRILRRAGRPFFIDKAPNNFEHIGLIQMILPKARIIDARRDPLSTCLSAFKQNFALGQDFTYSLEDLGAYYRDYVALMAHFDAVLPGKVHRVIYQAMVEDAEAETRRLLDFCGLPFEPRCLRFWENARAVRTASSEQVRRPIFRDGLEHWRNFEPWLGPLKAALGPVLEDWRG